MTVSTLSGSRAATYAAGVQREEPGVLLSLLVLVSGQTHGAVPSAELPARTASPAALSRAHEQRLALLTVLPLGTEEEERPLLVKTAFAVFH